MASDQPVLALLRPAPRTAARTGATRVEEQRLWQASQELLATRPELSAGAPVWRWQKWALAAAVAVSLSAAVRAPHATLAVLLAVMAVPFLCVVCLRLVALWTLLRAPAQVPPVASSAPLSRYSVLVPLIHEAHVVPGLVAALDAIDYPKDLLEILLITESVDRATQEAIAAARPPPHFRMIVVPDGAPRTKPRALNYALAEAGGDYVVVYDAEDTPDPGQLRAALALLRDPDRRVGCVQARLAIGNGPGNFLTRQFAIEYAALFGAILPALERLRLPVPLGGTSNHFPRAVLDEVGAWDPYNVTEDADLGIRLARAGYAVRILDSTTTEEAPGETIAWRNQRTRWLKGWMQTWLVHMREPTRLLREVGPRRFIGLQVLMGGLIVSALVHPWFYVLAAADLVGIFDAEGGGRLIGTALWWLGIVNLFAGYLSAVALGWTAAKRQGLGLLAPHAVLMPIYWLAISYAAHRALWQLARAPYLWEKTRHGARPGRAAAGRALSKVHMLPPSPDSQEM